MEPKRTIIDWWKKVVLENYANFTGRASRPEYWWFFLANIAVAFIIGIVAGVLRSSLINGLAGLYSLAVLVPGLAVAVRRLHDIGKSGWFLLVGLIPLIGTIWLLVLLATDSQPGANQWGPNPNGNNFGGPNNGGGNAFDNAMSNINRTMDDAASSVRDTFERTTNTGNQGYQNGGYNPNNNSTRL